MPGDLVRDTEVGRLIRARNWAATNLGPIEQWPQSLKTVVRVMMASRFAMWMAWGPDLVFLCNDAYLPTVGIKRDWVIGARSDEVWAEIWPDIGPRIDHVLQRGEATWDEALLLYLERSGFTEETYHTFSYSPLSDDDGSTAGMLCVVAEVTDRVIGERQLAILRDLGVRLAGAATRAQVMTALEACLAAEPRDLPFALAYLCDEGGAAMQLAAAHRIAPGSMGAPAMLALDDSGPWPLAAMLATGETARVSLDRGLVQGLACDHWQGPPTQALVVPIKAAEGRASTGCFIVGLNPHRALDTGYQGFIELLTDQISAAIARADAYEKERARAAALAELDRAKTAFFSNVSHEFRTPLTLMLGPLEDALGDAGLPDGPRQRVDIAYRNALRLLRLVNALLDFSRIEAGRMLACFRSTDLAATTAELASSFRSATERVGLRLVVDTPPLGEPVYVDRDMWEKIVLNLLSNAFKFTFEGEIAVRLRAVDGFAQLVVSDTGTGIAESELPKLFERFHRVEGAVGRSFEGSGIGLALVQELVKQHGGEIAVQSRLGSGTAFTVTLPFGFAHLPADRIEALPDAASAPVRAQSFVEEVLQWLPGTSGSGDILPEAGGASDAASVHPVPGEHRRVLLADDNADLRAYIARLLTQQGYEVETAGDGEAALAALRTAKPDLLITDVMMPRLDGFGLLRAVRASQVLRDLPVIMLSARAGEEAKVEGLDAGADDYLTKPFSARELLARVSANIAMASMRREAAEAIRVSEARARDQAERMQLALDAGAVIGTWVWDIVANRFVGDERFARSFGLGPEVSEEGLSLDVVLASIHEEDRPRVTQAIDEALSRGGAYRCEYRVRQADGGYHWLEANGRVDVAADGTPLRFPGVLIDINHRIAIETALRELNESLERRIDQAIAERERVEEALRQAQKMEAVGQLTGGIAHDFNNLLTIITGNIDIGRRSLGSGETSRARRAMDNAQKGAERAASLTQRLLAFSRRQPLSPKPFNVDKLVAGMSDLLHRAIGEMVHLETVSTPGLWWVEADPNQLESALLNLAVNARDAMPEGGKLTIETANARLDEVYAAAQAEVAPGDYVVIAVTDTGHGMSKETAARVFDPFFTTKEVGKGTGLGLSMVYGFVKQSGGHVKIYSEPNHGTTIKIYLPRILNRGPAPEPHAETAVDYHKRENGILVVEDDHDVRAYTVEILREIGYRVFEAYDGPSALRLLERGENGIDLLFTDVVMPAMSGRELADRARVLLPDLKVLYTSGYTRNAIVHGGRLDAGVEIITKPFTFEALAKKIADVLDAGCSGRVLVVDDDPTVRMFAVGALEGIGYCVDEAARMSEAMGRIRSAQGRYDAVLIDMDLPEKRGDALASELRALYADLPILLATGEPVEPLQALFAGDRCLSIIAKPYDAARLREALEALGVACTKASRGV